MTPLALARVLLRAWGVEWDDPAATPFVKEVWIRVATAARAALTPAVESGDEEGPEWSDGTLVGVAQVLAARAALVAQGAFVNAEEGLVELLGAAKEMERVLAHHTPPPTEPEGEQEADRWLAERGARGPGHREIFIAGYTAALARARGK